MSRCCTALCTFNALTPPLLLSTQQSAIVAGILTEHYTADGESFENALGPNILVPGPSQCAKRLNGHGHTIAEQYGLAGTFGKDNGVAFSKNGGRSFTEAKTVPVDPNYALARCVQHATIILYRSLSHIFNLYSTNLLQVRIGPHRDDVVRLSRFIPRGAERSLDAAAEAKSGRR